MVRIFWDNVLNMIKKGVILIPEKGVIDLEGYHVEQGSLFRNINGERIVVNNMPTYEKEKRTIEDGYYAAFKNDHYGHFLLESLSRLYRARISPTKNIIWLRMHHARKEFRPWQKEILKLLGLDDFNHIVIDEATRVKKLYLPDPGYIISNTFTDEHCNFLSVYNKKIKKKKKLWLSRSRVDAGWVNEVEIEGILKNNGWEIFVPEEHSVQEQLDTILSAELVAGTEGSAFHALILADNPQCKVIIFSRRASDAVNGGKINDNYTLIASVKKLDQTVYYPNQIHLEGKGLKSKFLVNPKQVLQALNVPYEHQFDYYSFAKREQEKLKESYKIKSMRECIESLYSCGVYLKRHTDYRKEIIPLFELLDQLRPNGKKILSLLNSLRREDKTSNDIDKDVYDVM